MEYRNAIILVTGGSSGIGRAFVDRFLREVRRSFPATVTKQSSKGSRHNTQAYRSDLAILHHLTRSKR
jgi:NAD(P)-dependent dehydrogenase (short-subunit alcohol dehydrogenase family)